MVPQAFKVALLIETSRGYGRGLLRGITKYSRLYGPWQFHLTPGDFEQIVPRMKDWGGNGIIARIMDERTANMVLRLGIPAVLLDIPDIAAIRKKVEAPQYIELASDSVGAARLAAEHLFEKQFVNFAFAGYPGQVWSGIRETAFIEHIEKAGFKVHLYRLPLRFSQPLRWEKEESILAEWLSSLPKPIGLMACNDQRGREVLDACEHAGIAVPEEVAVIGVDNDELLCELSYPPLSSVVLNAEQGGYQAAKALEDMMKGNAAPFQKLTVNPLRVMERRSSEIVAIDDPEVAMALRYIHSQPPNLLTINRIVEHTAVSRRALELKFKRLLGETILQEIQKVRLEKAKRLLQETDLPVPMIAEHVGFTTASYLIQVFRKEVGMTPAKYRQGIRG